MRWLKLCPVLVIFSLFFVPWDRAFAGVPPPGKEINLSREKFEFIKRPPKVFVPFREEDFAKYIKTTPQGKKTVTLSNGKVLDFDEFLKELNEIENKLNEWGYSLRDKEKEIKIGRFIYPKARFELQRKLLLDNLEQAQGGEISIVKPDILKKAPEISPTTLAFQTYYSEVESYKGPKGVKEPNPFVWERSYDRDFGNDDFGVSLHAYAKLNALDDVKNRFLDINSSFSADITLFGNTAKVVEAEAKSVDNKGYNVKVDVIGAGNVLNETIPNRLEKTWTKSRGFDWSWSTRFPIGPLEGKGTIGFKGTLGITCGGALDISVKNPYISAEVSPLLSANAYAELSVGYEIASAGVGGNLVLIENKTPINGELRLVLDNPDNPYFGYNLTATNKATLLKGKLYVFAEVDTLLFGSKRYTLDLYDFDGFTFEDTIFSVRGNQPSRKERHLWLKIERIQGITPYTARNEKLEVEPQEFVIFVQAGGQSYERTVVDKNKDGVFDNKDLSPNALPPNFEIPLISEDIKVPISVSVLQKYSIGGVIFRSYLDLSKGKSKNILLIYDPKTKTFSGTASSKEEEAVRITGDSNVFGERYHNVTFKFVTSLFKAAPAEAK